VAKLARLDLYRLAVPLTTPYRLSFTKLKRFDTVMVRAEDGDGRSGWGEATLLTGYTEESVEQSFKLAGETANDLLGMALKEAKMRVSKLDTRAPFTATALNTAIEMLQDDALLQTHGNTRVPLLALLHGETPDALAVEIEDALSKGYGTFKVKVGFDADKDLERVGTIQTIVAGRARIRIDANQGFEENDACRFAAALNPEGIELLEQTCAAGNWHAAKAVAAVSTVPLMLDESIYTLADVDRAAELGCASFIKFKLMKAGGLSKLAAALAHIRALGMTPVLGNGVACDLGCWMEACIAARMIDNAGEMNGFLKTSRSLFCEPLEVNKGAVIVPQGFSPKIDEHAIERFAVDRLTLA
jgi:o-succinylbenzoate synthase